MNKRRRRKREKAVQLNIEQLGFSDGDTFMNTNTFAMHELRLGRWYLFKNKNGLLSEDQIRAQMPQQVLQVWDDG